MLGHEGLLGHGAFGYVYKKRSNIDNKIYALKIMKRDINLSNEKKE